VVTLAMHRLASRSALRRRYCSTSVAAAGHDSQHAFSKCQAMFSHMLGLMHAFKEALRIAGFLTILALHCISSLPNLAPKPTQCPVPAYMHARYAHCTYMRHTAFTCGTASTCSMDTILPG
jgi:hypothetical protein